MRGGRLHRLRFKVRNNLGDDLSVMLIKHTAPYTNYGLNQPVNVTTADQVVTVEFTTTPGDKTDARLMFWFADTDRAGTQWVLDDLELVEVGIPRQPAVRDRWVDAEPQ